MRSKKKIRRKKKIIGTPERPRLVVYRSLNYIYAQIVDDYRQKTLLGASNLSKGLRDDLKDVKSKIEASKQVGEFLAKKAQENDIKKVVFDRNGYHYHGRIKALAEGVRQGGLEF
ncbi:50S ribosomal protein L18 [Candidatus Saccharibacteria bacterium]|nr:50S ribosomal protein L18 [Candidatus Saccharibacteria bacterium]NIV03718.1 50S ribosomal protein L18 [Calditrichia bacterium]NIV72019.1 50S ribosomal protein L18 [Calditrichia bacterium]NIV98852.1 50S ribosomal protein L18 [Candidatus Saccharibacteria bacterium]NIW79129.1 50S ribosomal protein L18 [Calditrichia bacterium]